MRTITVEEHFASPAFLQGPGPVIKEMAKNNPNFPAARVLAALEDLGDGRIAAMDAAGIDVQVLSLTAPGVEQLNAAEAAGIARASNDFLGGAVRKHPERFVGLAALPTVDPQAAAKELDRTVREYGFKGAVINGHVNGRYLDDQFFWPIFEGAVALNVPIYLHPTKPPKAVVEAIYSGYSPAVNDAFSRDGWGWHIETATHVIRLMLGGVFDRYPKLQLLIGHLGEALPFMLPRMDRSLNREKTKLQKPISGYLRENVYYSFSGFNFVPTFLDLLLEIGVGRIMFSADYPYGSMKEARAFLDQLPVSAPDRERIAHGTAESLFGI